MTSLTTPFHLERDAARPSAEAANRRTFAIISHPDAGKTTLTEKFLLYAGAVQEAGAVRARAGRRRAASDWMALEQERGISISSTVLQFPYRDCTVNLLDTPGHRDFSEDTYRVLTAADAAVMVLDVAKGIEPQTLKLFEVCHARRLPVLTFLNKLDRPGRSPLELLDEIEQQIGLMPTPVTWPVGEPGDFRGVIDRRDGGFIGFERAARGGAGAAAETPIDQGCRGLAPELAGVWTRAAEECDLLDEVGATLDLESFLAGHTSPLFVGSALTNFGVRHLLDAVIDLAPGPSPVADSAGGPARTGHAVLGLRVQGAGQHEPRPPGPRRLRPGVLGPFRAGHGPDPRADRPALRDQVRGLDFRRRAGHHRRGLAGRRDRPGQRQRPAGRRQPLRGTAPVAAQPWSTRPSRRSRRS